MGDRCNIVVTEHDTASQPSIADVLQQGAVVFYGHWSGHQMPVLLQAALETRWRWDDPAYLARIIWDRFCTSHGDETGYGISTGLCDNQHPIMVVDVPNKQVAMYPEKGESFCRWTFEQYIALSPDELYKAYNEHG